jgi:hypothetical protein
MATAKKKLTKKQLMESLKQKGLKLPHGYELKKRKPVKKKK